MRPGPASYPGGKNGAGVKQCIINQIPPHDVYIEPFGGGGAILFNKLPAQRNIVVEKTAAVAAGLCDGIRRRDLRAEVFNCCGLEYLKHFFHLYRIPAFASSLTPAGPCDRAARDLAAKASAVGFVGVGRVFVYCDPPYLLSCRRSKRRLYRSEMSTEQHQELLDILCQLPAMVAVSGYDSPLYRQSLQSWRLVTFKATTRGGHVATEHLWMNYPAPELLHDYRYLGDNKRERERIARKGRTWAAGLLRLPPLERRAIMRRCLAVVAMH